MIVADSRSSFFIFDILNFIVRSESEVSIPAHAKQVQKTFSHIDLVNDFNEFKDSDYPRAFGNLLLYHDSLSDKICQIDSPVYFNYQLSFIFHYPGSFYKKRTWTGISQLFQGIDRSNFPVFLPYKKIA